ncbi:Flavanone 3-dioxygenase 2 [Linum perenne]
MPGVADGSLPVIDVPKVDISLLSSSCPATAKAETEKLRSALLSSLGLDESSLVDEMGEEPRTVMRLNLYPKCSVPDRVLGLNSHTDGSAITFLLQDKEVEGFQLLLKDGQWARVPVTPTDALLIKIGDQGEVRACVCACVRVCIVYRSITYFSGHLSLSIFVQIISNGEYKAPLHRGALNTKRARKSIAIFSLPGLDKAIGPAKGLEPARYKQITNYEVYHLKLPNHRALIDDLKIDPTN